MKKRLYIYLQLSYMFILVGCIKEIIRPAPVVGDVNVKMVISNGLSRNLTRTTNDNLFENENVINSIRIITFHNGNIDKNYYISTPTTEGITTITMPVLQTTTLDVYIIANEPARLRNDLNTITSEEVLKNIEYKMDDYFEKEDAFSYDKDQTVPIVPLFTSLPMSANKNINTVIGPNGVFIYEFDISRALARVDVWLRKKETTNYELTEAKSILEYNTYSIGRFFNVDNKNTLVATDLETKTVKAKSLIITEAIGDPYNELEGVAGGYTRVFTFYTPERTNSNPNELQFTMKKLTYGPTGGTPIINAISVDLNPVVLTKDDKNNDITTITRNNVYNMYCSISERGAMIFLGCDILPWKGITITVPSFD